VDYENIIYEKIGSIGKITLNRPEKLNALSQPLLADLRGALDEVENDYDIRVLILTAEGRAFSTGFDLTPVPGGRPEITSISRWDNTHLAPRTLMRLWYLRQPTIAAVNGYAIAAGNVLAIACDLVIASEEAQFGEPEPRHVAHSPFTILPWLMPQKHLSWFYYTGDTVDARTAERWNLVNKVVPADELQEAAMKLAERIAKVPPFSVQMMKRSIKQGYDKMGFTQAFEHHLVLRMVEGLVPGVPEKEQLQKIRESQGMKAFLEARDGPFAEQ